jgi:hypothetical protein
MWFQIIGKVSRDMGEKMENLVSFTLCNKMPQYTVFLKSLEKQYCHISTLEIQCNSNITNENKNSAFQFLRMHSILTYYFKKTPNIYEVFD